MADRKPGIKANYPGFIEPALATTSPTHHITPAHMIEFHVFTV
jgi:hypothetical protein